MLPIGVEVMWMARCKYSSTNSMPMHSHDFYHYVFVSDGAGEIGIGDEKYILQKKHLYLTPNNVNHCFQAAEKSELQVLEFKFRLMDPALSEKADQLPDHLADDRLGIENSLEFMMEEMAGKDAYYNDIINLKLAGILLCLIKKNESENDSHTNFKTDFGIKGKDRYLEPVIAYMFQNMHLQMDLKVLSDIMHLNKSYFCKIFTQEYGAPPIHLLNEMRITKARELLNYSDMNITQIAYETGFQSVHYFSRFFTQKEGLNPHEYRLKSRSNTYIIK